MAPAPRRRYSRIPVGYVEALPAAIAHAAPSSLALLLWLLLSPFRRTLPGVVRAGELTLADALNWKPPALKRCLSALEEHGLVHVDREARVIFVLSAIADDPPRNANVLKSWAADLGELPPSGIVAVIREAVTAVVNTLEEGEKLAPIWASLVNSIGNSSANSHGNSSPNKRGTPVPLPLPSPVPEPQPQPQPADPTPEDLTVYLEAFERLGAPFDFAAAAANLSRENQDRLRAIPLDELGAALEALATSFFAGERAACPPTLLKFITRAGLRQDLIEGKHAEVGRQWYCALCGVSHHILTVCQPVCRGCRNRHDSAVHCRHLEALEAREREEQLEREELEAAAREAGLTVEELTEKRRVEGAAKFKADLAAVRAKLGARA